MILLTLKVETAPTSRTDLACRQLVELANTLQVSVETVWNGVTVVARPGMSEDDVLRSYGWGEKMKNYPES